MNLQTNKKKRVNNNPPYHSKTLIEKKLLTIRGIVMSLLIPNK